MAIARGNRRTAWHRLITVLLIGLLIALIVLAACGDGDPSVDAGGGGDPEQRYTASTTVLESPDHGPQLCLGGVAESYPPQCGGPDVVGWDWDDVEGEESASGTTWGTYSVVGTWDGERLTLTEPPGPPTLPERLEPDFSTPCPEPAGGWSVVDPATATGEAQAAAIEHARAQPEFAGAWLDQSVNPAAQEDEPDERSMNDPSKLVLNLRFTGELDRHETDIREIWGGALCVSQADRTLEELEQIRQELHEELELLHSGISEVHGVVEVGVIVADPGLQESLDERHGPGTVVVTGALRPVA